MGRGPSYPYVGLEEAIGLAQKMYDYTKRAAAPVDSVITEAWKYTTTSSSGAKVLAALKAYGLVEDAPAASGKAALKLTTRSIRILLDDQDTPLRREEIRKAALSPKWYDYCWKTWGKEMPSSMKSNLLIEHGFVDSTVESFLKDYRKTMAFAGILDSKIGIEEKESNTGPQVGDWVQCDMKGQLRLPEPHKLIRIEDHPEHGKYGFVEGQKGGIEYEHLIKVDPPEPKVQPPNLFDPVPLINLQPAIVPVSKGEIKMQTGTFSNSEGVTGQLQWPSEMSPEAYLDFLHDLAGLRMRVRRAVPKDRQYEVQSRDEEAAKDEAQGMERSS
jgi:hypothetical protein